MADAFDTYQDQVSEFRDKLKYVEGASGMAVVVGKKVVGCDLFDKPSTCRKVWDRLLSGLVFDALDAKEANETAETSDIDQLLKSTSGAAWNELRRLVKAKSTGLNSTTANRRRHSHSTIRSFMEACWSVDEPGVLSGFAHAPKIRSLGHLGSVTI